MTFAELVDRIADEVDVDLEQAFADYRRRSGSEDVDGFLNYLFEQELIDAFLFSDLHTSGGVEVTQLLDDESSFGDWSAVRPTALPLTTGLPPATAAADNDDASAANEPAPPPAGASQQPPEPDGDTALAPRYALLGRLAAGAMGEVHIARDLQLRRKVAFKSVLPKLSKSEPLLARFLSEMQVTSQLEHPNIVPVYGLEVAPDGSLAYTMKLVQGRTLAKLISEARELCEGGEPLDEAHRLERRLEHLIKICDAVAYAHGRGVLHRDLKPSNVMIGPYHEVYLMDWGIARPIGSGELAEDAGMELFEEDGQGIDAARTRVGAVVGTPAYMSPEQASGRNDELDGRSDEYALGLMLQEVVTLSRAVRTGTAEETISRVRQGDREPMVAELPGTTVPRELAAIVRKATQPEPRHRYATVVDLAADLRRYLQGDAVVAAPDRLVQRVARWVAKHRMASLGIIMTVLAVAGVAAAVGITLAHDKGKLEQAHRHERKLAAFLSRAAYRGHAVDKELHRYEAALERLIGAAEQRVGSEAAADGTVFVGADFGDGDSAPDDLEPSRYYGRVISQRWPVFLLPPGLDAEQAMPALRRLARLQPVFRTLMLESADEQYLRLTPDQQRQLIARHGVPIERAFITLADGTHVAYPGMKPLDGDHDARQQETYRRAADRPGLHWGMPQPSPFGRGLALGCSSPLYDGGGRFRGVAGIEVALSYVVAELLELGDSGGVRTTMLVDRQGTVVARRDADRADAPASAHGQPLEFRQVVAAIRRGDAGFLQTDAPPRQTIVYQPLEVNDWYFVAVADTETLLTSADSPSPMAAHPSPASSPATTAGPPPAASPTADASAMDTADAGLDGGADADADADASADAGTEAAVARVAVGPPGVTVTVDGQPVRPSGGAIELRGPVGSIHAIVLHLGDQKTTTFVTLTAEGPRPSRAVARPAPAPAPVPTPQPPPPAAPAPPTPDDIYQ